jgi:magnesium-transporting ATPase (P-type)
MSSDELGALQGYADMFDRAVWLTIILAVALIAVTLWVSPHRRRTLIQLCVATIIALVLAGVAVRRIAGSVQENIVNLEIREAFGSVLEELQGSAQSLGIWILVIAALVAFLTWLAGRPEQVEKWIAAGRKATDRSGETSSVDQFVARHFDILAVALVVLTLVLAWFAAPGWFWGLVIAAVVGLLIWYGLSARARYELSQMAEEGAEPAEAVAAAVTETEDG